MKALSCFNGILTCQCIRDEKRFNRLCFFSNRRHFIHQLIIDGGTAGRIKKDNVIAALRALIHSPLSNLQCRLTFNDRQEANACLLRQNTELFHRGRAVCIQRCEQDLTLPAFFEELTNLTSRGRFT